MKHPIIIALFCATMSITGCMRDLSSKTDFQLCKDLAKYPSYNVNTKARKEEVRERGVNCRSYANRIDKELSAEKLARASAPRVSSPIFKMPDTYSTPVRTNCHTTSSGRVTSCTSY